MLLLSVLPALLASPICAEWSADAAIIEPAGTDIAESSGIAAGRVNAGVWYTLQDEDNDSALYLFSADGDPLGVQTIRGAANHDWEDLAAGPCPAEIDAEGCLYIADIGDNDKSRSEILIYIVEESTDANEDALACALQYPDGAKKDAEAILVHPDGTIRVVSKEGSGDAHIYRADALDCSATTTLTEEAVVQIDGSADEDREVTGGAIDATGQQWLLRTSSQALLWSGCRIDWSAAPVTVDLGAQPQGEGVSFDGTALIATSESSPFRLWHVPCATEAEEQKCCGCGDGAALTLGVPALLLPWLRRRSGRREQRGRQQEAGRRRSG